MKIEAGETYRNTSNGEMYLVLAIDDETKSMYRLAALSVNPKTYQTLYPAELIIYKKDLDEWEHVNV